MSKITGKFQITLPKRLVATYGIKVGDDVDLLPAGDSISSCPRGVQIPQRQIPKSACVTSTVPLTDKENATEHEH